MHIDDEEEDLEFEALLDRFRQASANNFEGFYMDNEDLFDVISYFIDTFDTESAQQGFEVAFRLFPNDPVFRLLYAKQMTIMGLYDDAEQELLSIQKKYPKLPEVYVEEVVLAHFTHREVDAIRLLNKAISLNYELPEAHTMLALEFLRRSDIDQALSHIQTAVSQDRHTLSNLELLLFPDFKSFKSDDLIDLLNRVADEYPMQEESWRNLGLAYFFLGRNQEALNAYQFQYSLAPDNHHILFNIADCYYHMGEYEKALQQYMEFKRSSSYPVDIQIGKCYYRMKQYDKALQAYVNADPSEPLYIFRYEEIVRVCRAMDNIPMAKNLLRQYLSEEHEVPVLMNIAPRLLSLLHPIKDQDEVLSIIDKLFSEDESEYDFFRLVLQLTYYYGTPEAFDLGIQIIQHYQESVINDTFVQYGLGIFYLEKGWNDKGIFHLEKAFSCMNQDEFEDFCYLSAHALTLPAVVETAEHYGLYIPPDANDVPDLFEESNDLSENIYFDMNLE